MAEVFVLTDDHQPPSHIFSDVSDIFCVKRTVLFLSETDRTHWRNFTLELLFLVLMLMCLC